MKIKDDELIEALEKSNSIAKLSEGLSLIKKLLDNVESDLCSENVIEHNRGYVYAMTINNFFYEIKLHIDQMIEDLVEKGIIIL